MGKPVVSVIIPVYNCEEYLPELLVGLKQQEYRDFEVLLIDDGSSDNSPASCDRFAAQNAGIRVFHQMNGGVSSARNKGLDEAAGRYVVFVDADDRIRPRYLLDLVHAEERQVDGIDRLLVLSDYQPFSEKGAEKRIFPRHFMVDFLSGQGLTAEHFRDLVFSFRVFTPCCKLYRRDIIEKYKLRFQIGLKSAEDFDFNIRYLEKMDRLLYIDSVQYEYRIGYKQYVPSNHGILGESEIKSAHIMANGITGLAQRMEVLDEVGKEIDLWAARKHYFNRLRMLFRRSDCVTNRERREPYRKLVSDPVYYSAARRGAAQLPGSMTKRIAQGFDTYSAWRLFYCFHRKEAEKI